MIGVRTREERDAVLRWVEKGHGLPEGYFETQRDFAEWWTTIECPDHLERNKRGAGIQGWYTPQGGAMLERAPKLVHHAGARRESHAPVLLLECEYGILS